MLEQGNAENKQQKNLYQEYYTPSSFLEQAVPGKQGQEQIVLVSKPRTSTSQ